MCVCVRARVRVCVCACVRAVAPVMPSPPWGYSIRKSSQAEDAHAPKPADAKVRAGTGTVPWFSSCLLLALNVHDMHEMPCKPCFHMHQGHLMCLKASQGSHRISLSHAITRHVSAIFVVTVILCSMASLLTVIQSGMNASLVVAWDGCCTLGAG